MSFRERFKKTRSGRKLQQRHNAGTKKTGGRSFSIFLKDKIPAGIEFWRCKEGDHLVDIIPFYAGPDMPHGDDGQPITEEGGTDYVLDLFVHVNVGNMNKPYVCPFENFGLPCPICEFMKANRLEKEDWKKLVAKHRVIYLIWSHDSREEEKKGLQIFEVSHFFMEEKIEEIAKLPRGGGYENFSHIDTGKSLAWKRKGAGQDNTQYLGHRFIEREAPIPDRILDQSFALDTVVNMHPSYEEIEKEFKGTLKKMKLLDMDSEEDDTPFDRHSTGDDVPEFDDPPEGRKRPLRKRPTQRTKPGSAVKPKPKPTGSTGKKPSGKRPLRRRVR